MKLSHSRHSKNTMLGLAVLVAIAVAMPIAAFGARGDDIPHENFDLVGSNLDFVISLLRSSISYSENALAAMYNENMSYAEQNLTVVREVLIPADRLLSNIRNIAGSYENLSLLLPPFADLSTQMDSFSSMEGSLIQMRGDILTASELANLAESQLLQALEAIKNANTVIDSMNRTIDNMLVSANSIINLQVEGKRHFSDNQLIPLIERLRDLLRAIRADIDVLVINKIPWTTTRPFLLLWLSSYEYYLDEQISGGGYLFYNGAFVPDHDIAILMDGSNLTSSRTYGAGIFAFAYQIPLNSSWLGLHEIKAETMVSSGTLYSSPIQIKIILVPTSTALEVTRTILSPDELLEVRVILKDVRGSPVRNASCHFILDQSNTAFNTDPDGSYGRTWPASDLGYGAHAIQAFFEGMLPYAASSSPAVSFEVSIATDISLEVVSTRIFTGYPVAGNGTLLANSTQPLPGQEITLTIDGLAVMNVTTDSQGQFSFSIPTVGVSVGAHILRAEFLNHNVVWRYSANEIGFTVYLHSAKQVKYPFFPSIPGWGGGGLQDTFVYLFIGPNSYYFWLLLLLLIGIIIKTYQVRRKRKNAPPLPRPGSQLLVTLETALEPVPQKKPTSEDFALELIRAREGPATPNESIVRYYQRLLSFLTRRDSLSFKSSMTHWEIARLLKAFGYPSAPVEKATSLFEVALYSGEPLSDDDTVLMSTTLTNLISAKRREATDAL